MQGMLIGLTNLPRAQASPGKACSQKRTRCFQLIEIGSRNRIRATTDDDGRRSHQHSSNYAHSSREPRTAGDWGGGDGVQMRETGKRLHQRGHEVVAVDMIDRTHGIRHCACSTAESNVVPTTNRQLQKPELIVVSPIWISLARALWGSRGTVAVLRQAVAE